MTKEEIILQEMSYLLSGEGKCWDLGQLNDLMIKHTNNIIDRVFNIEKSNNEVLTKGDASFIIDSLTWQINFAPKENTPFEIEITESIIKKLEKIKQCHDSELH